MRGLAGAGALGFLLVVVSMSAVVGAHPAGTDLQVDGKAVKTFEESFCLPMCQTDARQNANLPPAIVAETGSTLTWTTADFVYHSATSDIQTRTDPNDIEAPLGEDQDGKPCLNVPINPGDAPEPATFEIRQDGLYVTEVVNQETGELETDRCDEALALPGGVYSLTIHCDAHPRYQHQLITIVPAQG